MNCFCVFKFKYLSNHIHCVAHRDTRTLSIDENEIEYSGSSSKWSFKIVLGLWFWCAADWRPETDRACITIEWKSFLMLCVDRRQCRNTTMSQQSALEATRMNTIWYLVVQRTAPKQAFYHNRNLNFIFSHFNLFCFTNFSLFRLFCSIEITVCPMVRTKMKKKKKISFTLTSLIRFLCVCSVYEMWLSFIGWPRIYLFNSANTVCILKFLCDTTNAHCETTSEN